MVQLLPINVFRLIIINLLPVPEPLNLHGWQLVDELNRAFAGEKPSWLYHSYSPNGQNNVAFDGGNKNLYDPQNGYKEAYRGDLEREVINIVVHLG